MKTFSEYVNEAQGATGVPGHDSDMLLRVGVEKTMEYAVNEVTTFFTNVVHMLANDPQITEQVYQMYASKVDVSKGWKKDEDVIDFAAKLLKQKFVQVAHIPK